MTTNALANAKLIPDAAQALVDPNEKRAEDNQQRMDELTGTAHAGDDAGRQATKIARIDRHGHSI